MWLNFDPCGPLAPAPPNSRLSSLLWQSVQNIRAPMDRPAVMQSILRLCARKLGCASALDRSCITGWLDVAVSANCGIKFIGSPALTSRAGRYPEFTVVVVPLLELVP